MNSQVSAQARHTGLSDGAPDSVRCARLAEGEPATLGKTQRRMAIIHRTVRWCIGLSGEPTVASANGRPRDQRATHGPCQRSVGHTGLSGVHRTVRCANRSRGPTVGCARYGRRSRTGLLQWLSGGAPDCPMNHPTEGKFGLPSWPPTTPSCLGAIKGTPRRMEANTKLTRNILRLLDSAFTQSGHRS
jgi:hypothetical protein